jgi:hypothetical protein
MTSLDYFRRFYSAGARENEAIVSLAIGFEALLMDAYARVLSRILGRGGAAPWPA